MKELINKVEQWSIDRNLHSLNGTGQLEKFSEEVRGLEGAFIDTELMVQMQEKMMLTDDELEYGVLKQELFDKFGTSRVCTKCKSQVLNSDLPNYDYLCFECDENLYTFETDEILDFWKDDMEEQ